MSRPLAIPKNGFDALDAMHDASEIMSGSGHLSADLLRSGPSAQQRLALGAVKSGSSPASPTHRAVWGSIFHPGSNANMPRGRSRYDTVEPGSPSTWDHVLRAEQHARTSNGGGSGASTPSRTSMDGPVAASSPKIVDVGKLDALMQARFKQSNGKLSYHDYAEVMRGLSS